MLGSQLIVNPGQEAVFIKGGERQRAAIARALLKHPTVLLADEPPASDYERLKRMKEKYAMGEHVYTQERWICWIAA